MRTHVGTLDVVVRDGSTVCLREATDQDVDGLLDFLRSLSAESRYFRFMGLRSLDPSAVRALLSSPGRTATSLVAESGGRIVAFAGFYRTPESRDRAEVAFAVADALHGHGIGTRMLEQLARLAREQDIAIFDAYVMGTNHRMMRMFRDSGFPVTRYVRRRPFARRAVAAGNRAFQRRRCDEIAPGGDGIDEGVLRAANGRRRRRQP